MPEGLRNLYLLVSGDCNLACSYCYAQGGGFGGGPTAMSSATLRAALEKLVPKNSLLVVSFFGGEPLLELDLLQQAVAWGNALGAERGTRLRYVLTTNGTLLDDARLAFLKDHICHVAVSLDGGPGLTDASRRFKDGRKSVCHAVTRNLRRLRNAGIRYGLRGTVPEGHAEELAEAVAYLQGLAPASLRMEAATGARAWSREHWRAWTDAVCRLNRDSLDRLVAGEAAGPLGDIYRVAAHRLEGKERRYPCLAGQGVLAVSASGDVYPCDHFVGEASFCMGNVHRSDFPGERYRRIANSLRANGVEQRAMCVDCRVRHLCGGECPANSLKRQGSIAEPSPSHCVHTRRVLRQTEAIVAAALADPAAQERLVALVGETR